MNLRGKFAFALQSRTGYISVESTRRTATEVRQYKAEMQAKYPGSHTDDRVQKVMIVPFEDL